MLLPAYFFPTTILLVDDDELFAANLATDLSAQCLYEISTDLTISAKRLNDSETAYARIKASQNEQVSAEDEYLISVNYSDYYQLPYQANRFSHIAVLVVDYHMPAATGIEFINSLHKNNIKKILLTSASDNNIAIAAFNNGTIDKYVDKSQTMYGTLNKYIGELQHNYFYEKTKNIMEFLYSQHSYLSDANYFNLVKKYLLDYQIVEYYLLDSMGSYLMIDAHGKCYCLAVKPDSQLQYYYDIAVGNEADNEIIHSLKNRSKMPFFLTTEDREQPVQNWAAYLHPAQSIKMLGSILYYSWIENFSVDKQKEPLVSLAEYQVNN